MKYALRNIARFASVLAKDPLAAPARILRTAGSKLDKTRQEILAASGLGARLYPTYRGRGVAVMFHEIHEDVEGGLRMGCSPAQLRRVLSALKAAGRDFVTVEEAMRRLRDPDARDFALVSFDDGYRDNRDLALPIMQAFDAPLLLFTPTGMLTRDIHAWWLGLRHLFTHYEAVTIDAMEQTFACADAPSRNAALREATLWIGTDQSRADALRPTFARYRVSIPDLVDRVAFDEAELRAFAAHPLVTIGGHTSSHRFLSGLPADVAFDDIAANRTYLQALTGQPIEAFAYPYGSPGACGPREAEMVSRAGYCAGFTTRPGQIFPQHLERPTLIPREDLGGAHLSAAEMSGRLEGWRRALRVRDAGPVAGVL